MVDIKLDKLIICLMSSKTLLLKLTYGLPYDLTRFELIAKMRSEQTMLALFEWSVRTLALAGKK